MSWRLARSVAGWALLLLTVVALWPVQFGGLLGLTVVSGHSMEPTYKTGDVVVTWRGGDYRRGEVVVYKVPEGDPGAGHRVVHRITGGTADSGFRTRGDNNDFTDIWHPHRDDVLGHTVATVPKVGRVIPFVANPLLLAAALGVLVIALVWPRDGEPAEQKATARQEEFTLAQ